MAKRQKAARLSDSALRTFKVARDKLIQSNELLHEEHSAAAQAITALTDDMVEIERELAANDHVLANLVGFLP